MFNYQSNIDLILNSVLQIVCVEKIQETGFWSNLVLIQKLSTNSYQLM